MSGSEADLERLCVEHAEAAGGKLLKWVSPGTRGVPDRILLLQGCPVVFIELKKPGGKNREPLQEEWENWLVGNGFRHMWIDEIETMDWLLDFLRERTS